MSATTQMPDHFFGIFKDGIYSISQSIKYVGTQSQLLEHLAKFVPRVIPGILSGGKSLALSELGLSVSGKLNPQELSIKTHFRPMTDTKENVFLVPVWLAQKSPASVEMNLKWRAPADMILWLITSWETKDGMVVALNAKVYLVAQDKNTKMTYLLPLPNLYDDARVCMGNAFNSAGHGPGEQWDIAENTFRSTTWNNDLMKTQDQAVEMFRFDGDGNQLPLNKDWRTLCKKVNHGNYSWIAKL